MRNESEHNPQPRPLRRWLWGSPKNRRFLAAYVRTRDVLRTTYCVLTLVLPPAVQKMSSSIVVLKQIARRYSLSVYCSTVPVLYCRVSRKRRLDSSKGTFSSRHTRSNCGTVPYRYCTVPYYSTVLNSCNLRHI